MDDQDGRYPLMEEELEEEDTKDDEEVEVEPQANVEDLGEDAKIHEELEFEPSLHSEEDFVEDMKIEEEIESEPSTHLEEDLIDETMIQEELESELPVYPDEDLEMGEDMKINEEIESELQLYPEDDFREIQGGESVGHSSFVQNEEPSPESFETVESTETTTQGGEPYEGETTFYFEGEEQAEEYQAPAKLGPYEGEGEHETESSMSQIYAKLSPFFLTWSYGVKTSTRIINLTKENQFEVFYTASHFGVLYDYQRNTMRFLPGHNSTISSIAADVTGRWLVTADDGEDNVIIVWDHQRFLPCWSLFNVFPGKGTKYVQISQDAKYLTAVSNDTCQRCKLFMWTFGRDNADGEVDVGSDHGNVTSLYFNHMDTTQFAITTETKIMYCQWIPEKKIIESALSGLKKKKAKIGIFRETIYLDDNRSAVTSTSTGRVVVWCDALTVDPTQNTKGSINKMYIKSVKVHNAAITSILLIDHVIVTSSEGYISFHDQTLSLLYLVPKYQVEPIVSVSFNLQDQKPGQIDPFSNNFDEIATPGNSTQDIQNLSEEWDDITSTTSSEEEEEAKEEAPQEIQPEKLHVPSDYTIDMKPLPMRDLIFLTWNGRIGYVSHQRGKVRYFLFGFGATVNAMDCNPNVPHLAMAYSNGRVDLFDFRRRIRLVSEMVADTTISAIRYSPTGQYLVVGLTNGIVTFIDPILLTRKMKCHIGKVEIEKFAFPSNERSFAYYDKSNTLYYCKITADKTKVKVCKFMGGYQSHYKPIRDILFDEEYDIDDKEKDPRLFTIGEDRMLVEYDIRNSQPGVLNLKRIDKIEQSAKPICFIMLPRFGKRVDMLIANSEYKLKVFCRNTRICYKTTVGPTADSPVNFMRIVSQPPSAKMVYATERHIGLRLLPATGNPYEGMGMVGHPVKITSIAISHDYKYVFTAGLHDECVLAWKVNFPSVDIAHQLGGTGLEPFLSLIEGGTSGFLFKEIEDFFYYAQIIHQGEHANQDRSVSKSLALCEVPDYLRSLGYFPTEYEIQNIIREINYMRHEETGEILEELSFDECVKIYLNHRPVNGISMESINKALMSIADMSDPECIIVEKDELYRSLEERGEAMTHAEVIGYLCILLLPSDEKDPLAASMTLQDFAEDILGVDLTITEENVREVIHPSENKAST